MAVGRGFGCRSVNGHLFTGGRHARQLGGAHFVGRRRVLPGGQHRLLRRPRQAQRLLTRIHEFPAASFTGIPVRGNGGRSVGRGLEETNLGIVGYIHPFRRHGHQHRVHLRPVGAVDLHDRPIHERVGKPKQVLARRQRHLWQRHRLAEREVNGFVSAHLGLRRLRAGGQQRESNGRTSGGLQQCFDHGITPQMSDVHPHGWTSGGIMSARRPIVGGLQPICPPDPYREQERCRTRREAPGNCGNIAALHGVSPALDARRRRSSSSTSSASRPSACGRAAASGRAATSSSPGGRCPGGWRACRLSCPTSARKT